MRRLVLGALLALVVPLAPASAAERERWHTRVFAAVQAPGYPAHVFAHRNGRVYAGTYTNPQGDSQRSRIREWARDGTLLRSWAFPGQHLDEDHGVQVATQDRRGRLVLLEKSTFSISTLDVETGRFKRWATLPDLPTCSTGARPCSPNVADGPAIPNYATWGPGGALYVTDYGQAVIWKIPRKSQRPRVWYADERLDGAEFGTTGIVFRPGRRDLLITQQSTTTDGTAPTNGKLYRLPIRDDGRPGRLSTMWTSLPGDLPDGFGIARSGRIYLANAGLSQQIVVLSRSGEEIERFPEVPVTGENGSSVPFDTPSNATFLGHRVLVANQSFTGNTDHHAILDVYVGEHGQAPYLPRRAFWR
ncbi:MAG: SMP-30/gluconolactonase/LRE family protein [Nocardioides sp.]